MKPTYIIEDTEWNTLIQDVAHHFDDLTLKRGFQYYKQGRVLHFTMEAFPIMRAGVGGREDYDVTINLESITLSNCDCPVQGTCKHMAAVLLHFAEWQNRSVPLLVNAKASATSPLIRRSPASAESLGRNNLNQPKLQTELKAEAARIPSMSIMEWHTWFERCVAPLSQQTRNPQYVEGSLELIYAMKPELPPAAEQLFRLNAQLFLLEMLTKPARSQTHSFGTYMGYYTHLAVTELQHAIELSFQSELPLKATPEEWPRVMDTLTYLRKEMLTETRDPSYFSPCYHLLWNEWITPNATGTAIYSEELEQLQGLEAKLGASLTRQPWLLAQSWMHFRLAQDKESWSLLNTAAERPNFSPEVIMLFLAPLLEAEEWPRLLTWLVEMSDRISRSRISRLEEYAEYWRKVVEALPEAEPQMWNTLTEMLPSSRYIYDDLLLSFGKYQEWMDYQLAAGREPASFRVSHLQPLEKNAPQTLLPFYHQAVERYIAEKNRSSYKAAVKLMKRLQKLYKKMKQDERWESFLSTFTTRHSRLRALQEELRKGKLIP